MAFQKYKEKPKLLAASYYLAPLQALPGGMTVSPVATPPLSSL